MTNPTFNLVDEGWIPCVLPNDSTIHTLSIRETLNRAPDIVEIVDPSPLVTVALHRLLLAILHRCYGPATTAEWRTLWNAGRFDDRTNTYLDEWRHRFDLFDPVHPFYQVNDISQEYAKLVSRMVHDLALGTSATLWEHSIADTATAFTPAQAARYLVALQAFALGGLVSYRKDEKEHKSADAAPLASSAVVLVRGGTLWGTLMLNLHQYDGREEPFRTDGNDQPAWERDTPTRPGDREVTGYLDLLTWQSRQIQLYPAGEPVHVAQVAILKGSQFPQPGYRQGKETMLAFRRNLEAKDNQDPWPVLGFREERTIWRDSAVLFQSIHEQRARPRMFDWLAELVSRGTLEHADTLSFDLYGLASDQAKPLFWRHERLPLPLQYLDEEALQEQVQVALGWAEHGKNVLNEGLQKLAEHSITPYTPSDKINKNDKDRAKELVKSWGAERQYWARLDLAFRQLLEALPKDYDPDMVSGQLYGSQEMPKWRTTVQQAARASFDEVERSLDMSGRWLRAVALAKRSFGGKMRGVGMPKQQQLTIDQASDRRS